MTKDQTERINEWVREYLSKREVASQDLTPAEWAIICLKIPCNLFCWRVAGPVEVKSGHKCPECGTLVPSKTFWEHLEDDDPV